MSQVMTRRPNAAAHTRSLVRRSAAFLLLLVGLFIVVPAGAQAEDNPVTQADFCNAWSAVTSSPSVELSNGLSIDGKTAVRSGANCGAAGATITLNNASVVDASASGSGGNAAAQVVAAITRQVAAGTDPDLKEGDEVFKGAVLKNFNAILSIGYFQISGQIQLQFSNTTTAFNFKGNLYGTDRFTMNLTSPAGGTKIPGVGGDPLQFKGTLVNRGTNADLNLTGHASSLIVGTGDQQVSVSDADLELTLDTDQNFLLAVTGKIGLGNNVSAQGSLNLVYDSVGLKSFDGSGGLAVTIPAKGSSPEGSIKGDAAFTYTRDPLARSVTFTGDVRFGEALVTGASGTLDDQSATFSGNASITSAGFSASGAVEGSLFYGDNLAGRLVQNSSGQQVQASKGDAILKTASGQVQAKGLTVAGAVQFGVVGPDTWAKASGDVDLVFGDTELKGSAAVTWLAGNPPAVTFSGSLTSGSTLLTDVTGSVDGNKLTLKGHVKVSTNGIDIDGNVDGELVYGSGDLTGVTITDKDGNQVPATKGDFNLKAASASIKSKGFALQGGVNIGNVGGQLFAGGNGAVDVTYGKTHVVGSASIAYVAGSLPAVNFEGSLTSGDLTVLSAKGSVDGNKITFTGQAKLTSGGITAQGAIDGALFYGDDLSGLTIKNVNGVAVPAQIGDFALSAASGSLTTQSLTVSGGVGFGYSGGQLWVKAGGSVDLTAGTTNVKGSADFTWIAGVSSLTNFSGTVTAPGFSATGSGAMDGKKILFTGSATVTGDATLSGSVAGTVYYGDDQAGETVLNHAGVSVPATKGDIVVGSAAGTVVAKGITVSGSVGFGKVGAERWIKGGGSVDLTNGATTVKGAASIDWLVGTTPAVSFSGSVKSGDLAMASVAGSFDGKKLALSGAASLNNPSLSLSGAFDGVVYYGADLAGETVANRAGTLVQPAKGDFLLKSASGSVTAKGFTANGAITVGNVAGQVWVTGGGALNLVAGSTTISGSANVDWLVGTTPAVSFTGTIAGSGFSASASGTLDGKKIAFTGSAMAFGSGTSFSGAIDGVAYYGADLAGETVANHAGTLVPASKGDVVLKSATATVSSKGVTVSGSAGFGAVGAERWIKGGGSLNLTTGATKIAGAASIDWLVGVVPAVTFSGSFTNGTTTVASVNGSFDGNKIALSGNATITDTNFTLTGGIDGTLIYGDNAAGETLANRAGTQVVALKGDYLLKSLTGSVVAQGLGLSGNIQIGNVRGDKWISSGGAIDVKFTQADGTAVRIQGSATFNFTNGVSTGSFSGTVTSGDKVLAGATGTLDGKKLTFTAQLSSPTLSGQATGGIYYGDNLAGETIVNKAGATVPATKGDFYLTVSNGSVTMKQLTATANFEVKKVGTTWWVKADAQIKVSQTYLTFSGTIDSNGDVNLKGAGSVNFDGTIVAFSGSAVVQNGKVVLTGGGSLTNGLFTAYVSGTITKPDANQSGYILTGTVGFKFGKFQVAGANVRLAFGEGLTTSFSIKTCFLFICPNATYLLYFSNGAVARAEMNAPIAWAAQFLAIGAVALGPKVPISTKITGII